MGVSSAERLGGCYSACAERRLNSDGMGWAVVVETMATFQLSFHHYVADSDTYIRVFARLLLLSRLERNGEKA